MKYTVGQVININKSAVRIIKIADNRVYFKVGCCKYHDLKLEDFEDYIERNQTVTISKKEYEKLLDDSETLAKLQAGGVDNWEGYNISLK